MNIIIVSEFGSPEVLKKINITSLRPTENQVIISTTVIGVGHVDVMMRRGMYPHLDAENLIPGIEVTGVIKTVGKNIDKEYIGKRVYAIVTQGGYSEEVASNLENLIFLPDYISDEESIAFGVNSLVAYFSLTHIKKEETKNLLVRGANGGVGSMVLQLASAFGIDTTAVIKRESLKSNIKTLGIHKFFDDGDQSVRYDAIIDPVAGENIDLFVNLLKNDGKYILNGASGGFPNSDFGMSWLTRFGKSPHLYCESLSSKDFDSIRNAMDNIFLLAKEKRIKPTIAKKFNLNETVEAHKFIESGGLFGKVLIIV